MRNITLQSFKDSINKSENTLAEYSKEVEKSRYIELLDKITNANVTTDFVFYVFGMGAHPKSSYSSLAVVKGIKVVWFDSLISGLLRPLSLIIASYAGIIRIDDKSELKNTFCTLSNLSMVGLYIFNKSFEQDFIALVKKHKHSRYVDEFIKNHDSSYFIYQIDADNAESTTGVYEIVSYGKDCPRELFNTLDN